MRTPPTRGGAADDDIDWTVWTDSSLDSPGRSRPQAPRQSRRPAAARARLHAQTERLAWSAYLRAMRLQEDEPGPETLIIRNAAYSIWQQAFYAVAGAA